MRRNTGESKHEEAMACLGKLCMDGESRGIQEAEETWRLIFES